MGRLPLLLALCSLTPAALRHMALNRHLRPDENWSTPTTCLRIAAVLLFAHASLDYLCHAPGRRLLAQLELHFWLRVASNLVRLDVVLCFVQAATLRRARGGRLHWAMDMAIAGFWVPLVALTAVFSAPDSGSHLPLVAHALQAVWTAAFLKVQLCWRCGSTLTPHPSTSSATCRGGILYCYCWAASLPVVWANGSPTRYLTASRPWSSLLMHCILSVGDPKNYICSASLSPAEDAGPPALHGQLAVGLRQGYRSRQGERARALVAHADHGLWCGKGGEKGWQQPFPALTWSPSRAASAGSRRLQPRERFCWRKGGGW